MGPGFMLFFENQPEDSDSKCKCQYVANPSNAGMWGSQSIAPVILKPLHQMEELGQNQNLEA
jgi:hypothetical protein